MHAAGASRCVRSALCVWSPCICCVCMHAHVVSARVRCLVCARCLCPCVRVVLAACRACTQHQGQRPGRIQPGCLMQPRLIHRKQSWLPSAPSRRTLPSSMTMQHTTLRAHVVGAPRASACSRCARRLCCDAGLLTGVSSRPPLTTCTLHCLQLLWPPSGGAPSGTSAGERDASAPTAPSPFSLQHPWGQRPAAAVARRPAGGGCQQRACSAFRSQGPAGRAAAAAVGVGETATAALEAAGSFCCCSRQQQQQEQRASGPTCAARA